MPRINKGKFFAWITGSVRMQLVDMGRWRYEPAVNAYRRQDPLCVRYCYYSAIHTDHQIGLETQVSLAALILRS